MRIASMADVKAHVMAPEGLARVVARGTRPPTRLRGSTLRKERRIVIHSRPTPFIFRDFCARICIVVNFPRRWSHLTPSASSRQPQGLKGELDRRGIPYA